MTLIDTLSNRFKSTKIEFTAVLVLSSFLILLLLLGHYVKGIPMGEMTRDLSAVAGVSFYSGFLSQLGLFFWAASAAICLFVAKAIACRKILFRYR